ncbi:MAG: hypothetical protein SFY69_13605 [Planctomycetota bacterium]|nr:hypothetical protein [Planctomycetota bacterium]
MRNTLFVVSLLAGAGIVHAQCAENRTLPVDPVELVRGREVPGKPELMVEREGTGYLFATPQNKAAFEKAPARYEVADGGACGSMGPLSGLGDARRYAVHAGRIYFFASDGCKATFLKDPTRCIETADAAPTPTPEEQAAGLAIVDRFVAWAGGADAVRGVTGYRQTIRTSQKSGDKAYDVRDIFAAEFPGRFAQRNSWDDSWWTTIATPEGSVEVTATERKPFASARAGAFRRNAAHTPMVILKARFEPGFVAKPDGAGVVNETPVDYVLVHIAGATTRLAIGADGRPAQLSFRGRDGTALAGEMVRTFTGHTTVAGVTLPTAWVLTSEDVLKNPREVTITEIEINPAFEPGTFALMP